MKTFYFKFKSYIWTVIIGLIIGVGIFCLVFFLQDSTLVASCNGTAIAGVSLLCLGLLALVAKLGAFDTFAFGFKQLANSMFNGNPNAYNNMADYKMQKMEIRRTKKPTFLALMAVGLLFLLACLVLEIIFHTKY